MILPNMKYSDGICKSTQIKFGGLNRTEGAKDGELWAMKNLTGRDYPVLSTRPLRYRLQQLVKPNGLFSWGKLCWVDGADLYYDGVPVAQVEDSRKRFVGIGPYIVIFPDKVCYHTVDGKLEHMDATWEQGSETISLGSNAGYNAGVDALEIFLTGSTLQGAPVPENLFREGDAVTIYGVKLRSDGSELVDGISAIVRKIENTNGSDASGIYWAKTIMRFDDNTFQGMDLGGRIRIERSVPDFVAVCEDGNRLWGCDADTIYASKLGDPFNWGVYDGLDTDSWTVKPGTQGSFTGCCNYRGYPTFFKEDYACKVYGDIPSQFQAVDGPLLGPAEGCSGTMAVVNDALFYLGSAGLLAYGGTSAQPVGQAFGAVRFVGGVAGSDGRRYFGSLQDAQGVTWLCVYDAETGLWHVEDALEAVSMCRVDGNLYCLGADGWIWLLGEATQIPEESAQEAAFDWHAEFGDFTENDPNHKGVTKLQLRLQLEEGSEVRVLIQFDSDGVWRPVQSLTGQWGKRNYYLPIVPRRCDHYRIRLEGDGQCRVYSLTRESYSGSERNAR